MKTPLILAATLLCTFSTAMQSAWADGESGSRCEWCGVLMLAPAKSSGHAASSASEVFWSQGEAETNKIDLLLVFDKAAAAWAEDNGYGDVGECADELVAELNAGLANTELDKAFTFRLAGTRRANGSFAKYSASVLVTKLALNESLSQSEKTLAQSIRNARDSDKADIVALISRGFKGNEVGSGIAFTEQHYSEEALDEFKEMAFCAVDIESAMTRYTLLHEIGHVMGAGHSDSQAWFLSPGPLLFEYSSGYHFKAGGAYYTTVMGSELTGYDDSPSFIRMPFFSSPDFTMLVEDGAGRLVDSGVRVGTALNDNTRTLLETYPLVANFRVATPLDKLPEDPRKISMSARTPDGPVADGDSLRARVGVLFQLKAEASSSIATETTALGLPPGMTFDATTGNLGGVPTSPGDYDVEIRAKNSRYSSSMSFRISVAALPDWASGTYYGWADWDERPVYVKVIVKPNGKMKGAFYIAGANRFFTSSRYTFEEQDGDGGLVLGAKVTLDSGGQYARKMTLRVAQGEFKDRSGVTLPFGVMSFDGFESDVREDLWGDGGVSTARVTKNRIVSVVDATGGDTGLGPGDSLKFMLSTDGLGRYTGKISGVKVSGTSRFVRLGVEAGSDYVELAKMPVIIQPRPGTALLNGYAREAFFRFAVNGAGRVAGLKLTHLEKIP